MEAKRPTRIVHLSIELPIAAHQCDLSRTQIFAPTAAHPSRGIAPGELLRTRYIFANPWAHGSQDQTAIAASIVDIDGFEPVSTNIGRDDPQRYCLDLNSNHASLFHSGWLGVIYAAVEQETFGVSEKQLG